MLPSTHATASDTRWRPETCARARRRSRHARAPAGWPRRPGRTLGLAVAGVSPSPMDEHVDAARRRPARALRPAHRLLMRGEGSMTMFGHTGVPHGPARAGARRGGRGRQRPRAAGRAPGRGRQHRAGDALAGIAASRAVRTFDAAVLAREALLDACGAGRSARWGQGPRRLRRWKWRPGPRPGARCAPARLHRRPGRVRGRARCGRPQADRVCSCSSNQRAASAKLVQV